MFSIPTVMMSYHRRGFFQMCICFIQEFKVQNQSHRAHYSQGFCQRKNCNTVIFPAAPPSVPAVRGPPQGRSKKVVTGKTHNEHCPAYLAPDQQKNLALKNELKHVSLQARQCAQMDLNPNWIGRAKNYYSMITYLNTYVPGLRKVQNVNKHALLVHKFNPKRLRNFNTGLWTFLKRATLKEMPLVVKI